MIFRRVVLMIAVILGSRAAWAQQPAYYAPADSRVSAESGTTAMPNPTSSTFSDAAILQSTAPGGIVATEPSRSRFAAASTGYDSAAVTPERVTESSWYTRADYFHWNERLDGMDFVNEYGLLTTLGYMHRFGPERVRVEMFGGEMNYKGFGQFDDGTLDPLSSKTNYLGARAEYDLLLEPDWASWATFFLGVGTRFWFRDIKDGISQGGYLITGYEEFWWHVYPYLGFEKRRVPTSGTEFYWSGRIGMTPLNFERVSYFDVTLHPRTGITGQLEVGLRNQNCFAAAYFEGATWHESLEVEGSLQPNSQMTTFGLKAGFCF